MTIFLLVVQSGDCRRVLLAGLSPREQGDGSLKACVNDAGDCGGEGHSAGRSADDGRSDDDDVGGHTTHRAQLLEAGRCDWPGRDHADLPRVEPILDSQLAGIGSGGGLAPTIPKGMRACAVRVDEVVGVAGFVIPGMRVDVLVSRQIRRVDSNQGVVTETILQDIQVLSAGTDIQRDAEGKPQQVQVVNLLVTPEQAQLLSLAANSLKIQLVLRNPLDTQTTKVPETAMSNLFGTPTPQPTHEKPRGEGKPKAKPYSMTIINGNHTTEDEKFGSPEGQH